MGETGRSMIQAAGENVIVRIDDTHEKEMAKRFPNLAFSDMGFEASAGENEWRSGQVLSIGPRERELAEFRVGDTVLWQKFSGQHYVIDGEILRILKYDEILGVVELS